MMGSLIASWQGCQPRSEDCGEDAACFAAKLESCTERAAFVDSARQTRWAIAGYAGPDCHLVAVSAGPPRREAHCIFPSKVAGAWRSGGVPDAWRRPEDDEACYEGDGKCRGIPHLAPLCVLGDCVAGRWTYTCEQTPAGRVEQCEGTKALDRALARAPPDAGCWLQCPQGKPRVECWTKRLLSGAGP